MDIVFSEKSITVADGVGPWLDHVKRTVAGRILAQLDRDTSALDHYLECVGVKDLPGAYVCAAFYESDLNATLTRAGLYMGAGKGLAAGTLVGHDEPILRNYQKLVAGHNLPGPVLRAFFAAAEAAKDERLRPSAVEAKFKSDFLTQTCFKDPDRFYLIGLSVQSTKDQPSVFSHEIFHALYHLRPEYRSIVRTFWRDALSDADRAKITEQIGRAYNVEDEDLVIDEFQAYLLQPRAERDLVRDFVAKYRAPLGALLRDFGIEQLQSINGV